jgi:hypothetical protein
MNFYLRGIKMLKSKFSKVLLVATLMFSSMAMAAVEINTNGLNDSQKAELVKAAEAMKATAPSSTTATVEAVDRWADVSLKFAKAIGVAAKELGIAANDFLKTPAGMMTAGVIVFQYMGGPIIHVGFGLLILLIGIGTLTWFNRAATRVDYEYDTTVKNIFGNYPLKGKIKRAISDDVSAGLLIGYLLVLVISIWVTFSW